MRPDRRLKKPTPKAVEHTGPLKALDIKVADVEHRIQTVVPESIYYRTAQRHGEVDTNLLIPMIFTRTTDTLTAGGFPDGETTSLGVLSHIDGVPEESYIGEIDTASSSQMVKEAERPGFGAPIGAVAMCCWPEEERAEREKKGLPGIHPVIYKQPFKHLPIGMFESEEAYDARFEEIVDGGILGGVIKALDGDPDSSALLTGQSLKNTLLEVLTSEAAIYKRVVSALNERAKSRKAVWNRFWAGSVAGAMGAVGLTAATLLLKQEQAYDVSIISGVGSLALHLALFPSRRYLKKDSGVSKLLYPGLYVGKDTRVPRKQVNDPGFEHLAHTSSLPLGNKQWKEDPEPALFANLAFIYLDRKGDDDMPRARLQGPDIVKKAFKAQWEAEKQRLDRVAADAEAERLRDEQRNEFADKFGLGPVPEMSPEEKLAEERGLPVGEKDELAAKLERLKKEPIPVERLGGGVNSALSKQLEQAARQRPGSRRGRSRR